MLCVEKGGRGGEIRSHWVGVGVGPGKDVCTPLICERISLSLLMSLRKSGIFKGVCRAAS